MSKPHHAAETVITGGERMLVWDVIVFPVAQSGTYTLAVCYLHTFDGREKYMLGKKVQPRWPYVDCPQSWITCLGIKVRKANTSKRLLMSQSSESRNGSTWGLKTLSFFLISPPSLLCRFQVWVININISSMNWKCAYFHWSQPKSICLTFGASAVA